MNAGEPSSVGKFSQYRWVARELVSRTFDPLGQLPYVSYFLVAMIIVGPMSIWFELYAYLIPPLPEASALGEGPPVAAAASLASLRTALLTFFPAVAATAAMQLVWAEGKVMRSVAVLLLACIGVAIACVYPERIKDITAVLSGAALTIIALWLWWIANARNSDLLEKLNPENSIGGTSAGGQLKGDLSGFKTS